MNAIGISLAVLVALACIGLLWFEIAMFLDILKNPKLDSTQRLIWAFGMLLLHPIIAVVYYFAAHSRFNSSK